MSFWKKIGKFFSSKETVEVKKTNVNLDSVMKEAEVVLDKFKPIKIKTTKGKIAAKRARTKKGLYKKDNKATININEAWVGGKAPIKKKKVIKKKK